MKYDLVVIGAGPGGYVAAIRAAQLGLKVACVEKGDALGGTCLNVGCIPSKTLLSSSELYWKLATKGKEVGIHVEKVQLEYAKMAAKKDEVVSSFTKGIEGLFKKNKIDWIKGIASFVTPEKIQVGKEVVEAKYFLIATGSEPISLPNLPFDEEKILSSTGALALKEVPQKLLVVGAGVIGVELGSVFKRLGAQVEFVEFLDHICPAFDKALSKGLQKSLSSQGMVFHLSHKVIKGEKAGNKVVLTIEGKEGQKTLEGDKVLIAVGRRANTKELGLEKVSILLDPKGRIPVNSSFQTAHSHIFAIGDVIDGPMLAHKASEEGIAVAELIAGHRPTIDYLAIPNVAYTYPEVASVGLTEEEVKEKKIPYKMATFPMKANSRARSTGEDEGFVKIIALENKEILGVHILSSHASEMIGEGTVAIQNKLTVDQVAQTCHAHPTLSEALKEGALSVFGAPIHL